MPFSMCLILLSRGRACSQSERKRFLAEQITEDSFEAIHKSSPSIWLTESIASWVINGSMIETYAASLSYITQRLRLELSVCLISAPAMDHS